jgi:hypothetical protein
MQNRKTELEQSYCLFAHRQRRSPLGTPRRRGLWRSREREFGACLLSTEPLQVLPYRFFLTGIITPVRKYLQAWPISVLKFRRAERRAYKVAPAASASLVKSSSFLNDVIIYFTNSTVVPPCIVRLLLMATLMLIPPLMAGLVM